MPKRKAYLTAGLLIGALVINLHLLFTTNKSSGSIDPVREGVVYHFTNESATCPKFQRQVLTGAQLYNVDKRKKMTETEVMEANQFLQHGGIWRPSKCVPFQKLVVIVVSCNVRDHALLLLSYLIPLLFQQFADFRIFLVEPTKSIFMNKGRLMNAAFTVALREVPTVNCVIFHDADSIPQRPLNMYRCTSAPRHLSPYYDVYRYKFRRQIAVSGVLAITPDYYRALNGFSNAYWSYGGFESLDMLTRINNRKLGLERPNEYTGRYALITHDNAPSENFNQPLRLLRTAAERMNVDGLANTNAWTIVNVTVAPLFTIVLVNVGQVCNVLLNEPCTEQPDYAIPMTGGDDATITNRNDRDIIRSTRVK